MITLKQVLDIAQTFTRTMQGRYLEMLASLTALSGVEFG